MRLNIILQSALKSLRRHKLRSFLTTLGVIIGVSAVILLVSIGNGLKGLVTEQFQSLGSNLLYITPGELVSEEGGFSESAISSAFMPTKFKLDHVDAIKDIGDPITGAVPLVETSIEARYKTQQENTYLHATNSEYSNIRNLDATKGRFFTNSDDQNRRRVAVLGPGIKEDLFSQEPAVGKDISLNGIRFTVIGVVEEKGSGQFGGPDIDSIIYIPLQTGKSTLEIDDIQYFLVQVSSEDQVARGKILVERTLNRFLDEDDFSVTDQEDVLKSINTILSAITGALSGIAAISLLVGGIGIMNIMLVAVTERTKEIGLRKALGATPQNILIQFLIESSALSAAGGIIGILLGAGGALALDRFIPAKITLGSVLLAFSVSVSVGIIFGVFPARKASRLSPIEALRYE